MDKVLHVGYIMPARSNVVMDFIAAVSEVSCDSRQSVRKSFALVAIIPVVFVVKLCAYGPAFEDTLTNPREKKGKEGGEGQRGRERERGI